MSSSSSSSTTTTASSKPTSTPLPKNHVCQWEGCGKRFTRAEHLRRHALNHELDDNSCERCGVHFSRPDLLGKYTILTYECGEKKAKKKKTKALLTV